MDAQLLPLIISACAISGLHTLTGPDHYLPFIVLSRSRRWTLSKTLFWTILCGFGHILSSLLIGMLGVVLGWQLSKVHWFQDVRGNFSGWCLLAFGIVYLIWGIYRAHQNKPHKHFDVYANNEVYVYEHRHGQSVQPNQRIKVTPWILFAIFVMGPSEPLVPLLFYSGSRRSITEIATLITAFTLTTILTMVTMVLIGCYGYGLFKTEKLERYVHVIGGGVITVCGLGMVFFGW
jgi:sulfite exporter TauE/SafE